jgi:hypothetical protein
MIFAGSQVENNNENEDFCCRWGSYLQKIDNATMGKNSDLGLSQGDYYSHLPSNNNNNNNSNSSRKSSRHSKKDTSDNIGLSLDWKSSQTNITPSSLPSSFEITDIMNPQGTKISSIDHFAILNEDNVDITDVKIDYTSNKNPIFIDDNSKIKEFDEFSYSKALSWWGIRPEQFLLLSLNNQLEEIEKNKKKDEEIQIFKKRQEDVEVNRIKQEEIESIREQEQMEEIRKNPEYNSKSVTNIVKNNRSRSNSKNRKNRERNYQNNQEIIEDRKRQRSRSNDNSYRNYHDSYRSKDGDNRKIDRDVGYIHDKKMVDFRYNDPNDRYSHNNDRYSRYEDNLDNIRDDRRRDDSRDRNRSSNSSSSSSRYSNSGYNYNNNSRNVNNNYEKRYEDREHRYSTNDSSDRYVENRKIDRYDVNSRYSKYDNHMNRHEQKRNRSNGKNDIHNTDKISNTYTNITTTTSSSSSSSSSSSTALEKNKKESGRIYKNIDSDVAKFMDDLNRDN